MAKKPSGKPKPRDLEINIDGNVSGKNVLVGSGNIVNLPSEQIKLNALHQFPPAPADFTGRDELISQLLSDFNSHKGATLSGLTGMGGIGKTALGLAVANRIKDNYSDAQIFLDLKGTTAPLSAVDIARHVILSFEPTADLRGFDESNFQAAYHSVLHGKKALLFFDNARSAEQIAPLRPPADCAMLVTSRWTFAVAGLQARRVNVLTEADAVKFLLELCPRIADKAADLAKACAYLPLALRIAGSFLLVNSDWSLEKYLSQLSDRKKRLETLKQSRNDAELTTEPDLLATFELSYNTLPEEDRKHWRMLGVFPASFAGNAAQAMWGLDENETPKTLSVLRRYSLLDYDETNSRYFLHDLLADFALAQMEVKEEQEVRISHATFYMNIMRAADSLYFEGGEKILQGLRLFDLEWAHVSKAHLWSASSMNDISEAAIVCNYKTIPFCLNLRVHPRLQIEWLNAALLASQILKDRKGEGIHLGNLGNAYVALGDARKAIEFYEQALIIAHDINDRGNEGNWLGNLGITYAALGDARKAIDLYERQLVIAREIGDRRGEGNALGNLGNACAALGDTRKAIDYHGLALGVMQEIGDKHAEGLILGNLGLAYADLGDTRKAIEYHEQALGIDREIGDRHGEGAALGNLGAGYALLGDVKKAIEFYEQYLLIAREIGNRHGEGIALGDLGSAYFKLKEFVKAGEYYAKQLIIVQDIGDRYGEGNALWGFAICEKEDGKLDEARGLFLKALEIFRAIESPSAATIEKLLAGLDNNESENQQVSVQDFVRTVIQAHHRKSPQAGQYFETLGKMAVDSNALPERRELAKVLRRVMSGVKDPDLSTLPEELANLVREELARKE